MSGRHIERITSWEALDSRGTPTVGCCVHLEGGAFGSAIVPSGASRGRHEAVELRDGEQRYDGLGVKKAVQNVINVLGPAVRGLDASDQAAVDAALREADGTADLRRLGGNAVLAVSVATANAASTATREPLYRFAATDDRPLLPMPMVNIISGGAHAGWGTDVQDYLAVPVGARTFSEAMEWVWRVRRAASALAAERGLVAALVADEGGLGPGFGTNREPLELLTSAIERARLVPGDDVAIAVDVAATQLALPSGEYMLRSEGRVLTAETLVDEIGDWVTRYPIVSVEDPLAEDDWEGWRTASARLPNVQLLGDDLFATSKERLERGIRERAANAVLVKPNQSGTLSGAHEVLRRAAQAGFATILSARSGDTEDAWLADLAVAWRSGQIKVGSTMRSERTAKWNRLLQIEAELGDSSEFAARTSLGGWASAGSTVRQTLERP